jgi:hypothetical protein
MSVTHYRYDYRDYGSNGQLYLRSFITVKKTPKGAWVTEQPYGGKPRFILDQGTKRFAYPDLDQALKSLIARKRRQISILTYQLEDAKHALELAQEESTNETRRLQTINAGRETRLSI